MKVLENISWLVSGTLILVWWGILFWSWTWGNFHFIEIFDIFLTSFAVKEGPPVKSSVIGRPVLLALEDVDGTPSFLEKALNFMEEYGGSSAFPPP